MIHISLNSDDTDYFSGDEAHWNETFKELYFFIRKSRRLNIRVLAKSKDFERRTFNWKDVERDSEGNKKSQSLRKGCWKFSLAIAIQKQSVLLPMKVFYLKRANENIYLMWKQRIRVVTFFIEIHGYARAIW